MKEIQPKSLVEPRYLKRMQPTIEVATLQQYFADIDTKKLKITFCRCLWCANLSTTFQTTVIYKMSISCPTHCQCYEGLSNQPIIILCICGLSIPTPISMLFCLAKNNIDFHRYPFAVVVQLKHSPVWKTKPSK